MRSQVAPRTIWTVGLNLLLVAGVGFVLLRAWTVLSWVLLGLILALALEPFIGFLERHGWKRHASVALLAILLLGTAAAFAATFIPLVAAQAHNLAEALPHLVEALGRHAWVRWADEHFGILGELSSRIGAAAPQAATIGLGLLKGLASGLVALTTVITVAIFASLFGREVADWLIEWFHPQERARIDDILAKIRSKVGGYVAGMLLLSVLAGLVTSITELALGVPYFLALGLAMAVFTLIPIAGSVVATVLAVGTTLAAKGVRAAVFVTVVLIVYPWLKNHFIQPLVMRHTIRMNPLVITIVVLVGVAAGGLLGIVMALPVSGAVQVLLEDLKARHLARAQRQPPGTDQATPR